MAWGTSQKIATIIVLIYKSVKQKRFRNQLLKKPWQLLSFNPLTQEGLGYYGWFMSYLLFKPIYQERVWGGRNLETHLGRKLPEGKVIGESWDVVDRPEAMSVVNMGPWKDKTLREILTSDSEAIMGPGWDPNRPFPVLIKWLDCQERLSLQVHPPAEMAKALNGEPKTENWYIIQATPDAGLIAGVKRGVTREQFAQAIEDNTLEECIHRYKSMPGDSLFVQSGRLHAIDAGNVILEIQQNSDTTYRVYDWGRVGLDGKPRELHVDESLQCIDFNDNDPQILHTGGESSEVVLADCNEFRIRKITWNPGQSMLEFKEQSQPRLLSIISGSLECVSDNSFIKAGMNILLPYADHFDFKATEPTTLLITDQFNH